MNLKYSLQNTKLFEMDQEVSEYLWHEFHCGNLNDEDDFHALFHDWIDNQVIYYSDCEAILERNLEYCFIEHEIYGRPENSPQAAYACLYDYLMDSPDLVTWSEMEHVLHEADTKIK